MKRFAILAGTALLATAMTTPAALAETNSRTQSTNVIETQEFAAPIDPGCTVTQIEAGKNCDTGTIDSKPKYPTAPVFPQFGI